MTDNEIIKALGSCPYQRDCVSCDIDSCNNSPNYIMKCTRDLINRQKAEIERLKAPTTDWLVKGFSKEELERIKIEALKAEAIKEYHKKVRHRLLDKGFYPAIVKCVLDEVEEEMVGDK